MQAARVSRHKIEQPSVAVKALGDNELADWVERIASAPNIGLLDEYKSYLRECAMRMKERGRRLKEIAEACDAEEAKCRWAATSTRAFGSKESSGASGRRARNEDGLETRRRVRISRGA